MEAGAASDSFAGLWNLIPQIGLTFFNVRESLIET